ncbi:uncharacterized protein LOC134812628 isoform X2 [Bolinopsis microptera]|uniref:uncharacterized protein LOC134812628 isoform X2 n=1 Tax=Bolinopsis microptera TaxID=2820187 RepID=UPI00307AD16C
MGSRIKEKEILYLWRITLFFNMVIMNGVNSSSFIVTEDLYTNENPPFTLPVFYTNSMDSPISLKCKTVNSNSGLTAQTVTLPVGSNQKVDVVFSGSLTISLPFEVSCSVEDETEILTKSIVSDTERVLGLCHLDQLYADPTTGKVEIRTAETQGDITLNFCSCINVDEKSILLFDDKDTAEVSNGNCVGPVCKCTLKCTYNTNQFVSRELKVLKPVLYIKSSFEKLTLFKNTSTIAAFTFPPSKDALECFANKVDVSESTFLVGDVIKNGNFKDLVLEESQSDPGVYHVFPKDSAVLSGVYGIKCTSGTTSDTFVFEFDNSEASNIVGEKIDFDEYVSVPCSCDKTPGFCDHRCCCDSDCSDVQEESFSSCIEGPKGGDHTVRITPSCSDVSNVSPWERALCIKTSNSAFLGRYFNFVNRSFTAENEWDDSNIAGIPTSSSKSTKGYPIFTLISLDENTDVKGFLTLPGRVGRSCISADPLKLLENSHAICSREVTDNCNMEFGGAFSARSYLSPTERSVDPCGWFTRVYSNGVNSNEASEAIIKVLYKKDGVIINNLASKILQDQSCEHAVTGVLYEVSISSGVIIYITATITIQDLRNVDSVMTSYSVVYKSADMKSVIAKEMPPEIGYKRHEPLLVSSGTFQLPQYGNCDDDKKRNTPEFRVSTIVQCYKIIQDNNIKQNCSALYDSLLKGYFQIIENGTMIGSTPGNSSLITATLTNPLNITDITETELCDYLPSYLHIKIYHKNNTLSGEDITNVTFSLEHGSITQFSGDRFLLQADLQYLISDVPVTRGSLSFEDIIEFFENKQELLNSLIVVFAALIYFAIPKNLLSSKL